MRSRRLPFVLAAGTLAVVGLGIATVLPSARRQRLGRVCPDLFHDVVSVDLVSYVAEGKGRRTAGAYHEGKPRSGRGLPNSRDLRCRGWLQRRRTRPPPRTDEAAQPLALRD